MYEGDDTGKIDIDFRNDLCQVHSLWLRQVVTSLNSSIEKDATVRTLVLSMEKCVYEVWDKSYSISGDVRITLSYESTASGIF